MPALQNRAGRTGLYTKARIPDGKNQTRGLETKRVQAVQEKAVEFTAYFLGLAAV